MNSVSIPIKVLLKLSPISRSLPTTVIKRLAFVNVFPKDFETPSIMSPKPFPSAAFFAISSPRDPADVIMPVDCWSALSVNFSAFSSSFCIFCFWAISLSRARMAASETFRLSLPALIRVFNAVISAFAAVFSSLVPSFAAPSSSNLRCSSFSNSPIASFLLANVSSSMRFISSRNTKCLSLAVAYSA